MGIQLLPENHEAMDIYLTVHCFGRVTFEAIDRALSRFKIGGVAILKSINLIHQQFEEVAASKKQQQKGK